MMLFPLLRLVGAFLLLLILPCGLAGAASPEGSQPTTADFVAVSKALGFVEGQARFGAIHIGILHLPDDSARGEAARAAALLAATPGPGATVLVPILLSTAMTEPGPQLNALFVMPNAASSALEVLARNSAKHLLTISTHQDCLTSRTCMLMVRAEPKVTIVLDTALADAAAIRFSPIFIMMVKRR